MILEKRKFYTAEGLTSPIYVVSLERLNGAKWIITYNWPYESLEHVKWRVSQKYVEDTLDKMYKEVDVSPVVRALLGV
jgi:hypothetical protein